MKVNSVFVAFAIIGFAAVWAADGIPNTPGFSCTPGETFKYECNTCWCAADGKNAACTLKGCLSRRELECEEGDVKEVHGKQCTCRDQQWLCEWKTPQPRLVHDESELCQPGEIKLDDCNICRCIPNGGWACTKINCPKELRDSERTYCNPGEVFKQDCNTCTCSPDGQLASCTKMACPKEPRPNSRTSQEYRCTPGQYFQDGCNHCVCNEQGDSAACTVMACLPEPRDSNTGSATCNPDEIKAIDCNVCKCTNLGWLCTKMNCPENVEEETCTPGEIFKKDCNTCRCSDDGKVAACTLMACPPEGRKYGRPSTKSEGCTPGQSFLHEDGCNTCICNEDGTNAACTVMACVNPGRSSRPAQVCTPNTVFKDDCNTCWCNENGTMAACTKMACGGGRIGYSSDFGAEYNSKTCKPGDIKNIDCNICICGQNGWACTRMGCPDAIQIEEPESIYTERCSPKGGIVKKGCNTCGCSDEGRITWCTLIGCARSGPKQICTPEEVFLHEDGCNTCICNKDGTNAACTKMACPRGPRTSLSRTQDQQQVCVPGSNFRDECNNMCRCNENGTLYACTLMACTNELEKVEKTCVPNSIFKDDCNTCRCNAEGTEAACTKMQCSERSFGITGYFQSSITVGNSDSETCNPDDIKTIDCNVCRCSQGGWLCTKMACPEQNNQAQEEEKCTPGESFKKDCNDCICSEDGKAAACTLMACLPSGREFERTSSSTKRCTPKESFLHEDGCNTCICNDVGTAAACTLMACMNIQPYSTPEQVCEPGSTFKDDCNTCWCNTDGTMAACTKKACLGSSLTRQGNIAIYPIRRCEPGSSFKEDCNTCVCNDDGTQATCTLMACSGSRHTGNDITCEPGTTFKIECNTCLCLDGKSAGCTRMGCPDSLGNIGEPDFYCRPGTSFKQDCNSCICGEDGKSGACTRKNCPKRED